MPLLIAWRMAATAFRLAWPHPLAPWRSPLVRWRMETYGISDGAGGYLSASAITPAVFCSFLAANRRALWRFLRWSAALQSHGRTQAV